MQFIQKKLDLSNFHRTISMADILKNRFTGFLNFPPYKKYFVRIWKKKLSDQSTQFKLKNELLRTFIALLATEINGSKAVFLINFCTILNNKWPNFWYLKILFQIKYLFTALPYIRDQISSRGAYVVIPVVRGHAW